MKTLISEFKEFVMRGNVIDLAIAVVIGAAFSAVVSAFVKDLITPLIAAVGGQPDFSAIALTLNNSTFKIGDFINELLSFLIIAAVIFFLVIKPLNALLALRKKSVATSEPTTRECPYCLSEIPAKATRCAHCTAEIPAAATVQA